MPRYQVCPTRNCGQLRPIGGDCPNQHRARAAATDNQRRHTRQTAHGRDTARWRRLARLAKIRDGGCVMCGTTVRLSAHLTPEMRGDHRAATLDDIATLCARCHGQVDGPRSKRGGGVAA